MWHYSVTEEESICDILCWGISARKVGRNCFFRKTDISISQIAVTARRGYYSLWSQRTPHTQYITYLLSQRCNKTRELNVDRLSC